MWDTSCPDWRDRLLAGRSLVPDLPLFREEAARALRVFRRLRLSDVIGTPTVGEAGGPWLFPIVEALFGAYDPQSNRRMIRELFLLVPKKNAKTSTAALIMLAAQILNRRPEAESSLIAPAKDVAERQFNRAAGAIRLDPELDKLFQVQHHIRTIQHRLSGARLTVRAADEDIVTGLASTYTVIDETHVLGAKPSAPALFTEIRGALTARPDGFLVQITTQSKEPPAGQFRRELAIARKVRDGALRLPLLPVLYELPEDLARDGGWKDRRLWPLVNPNFGRSVDAEFLETELVKAEDGGAEALALLASQHFNVEIGQTQAMDGWEGAPWWEACIEPGLDLAALIARSEVAVAGIDGGGLDDLLGLCIIGREKATRRWLVWTHAWCHRAVLARRKEIAPRLLDFAREGDLTIVDTVGDDVAQVADYIEWLDGESLLPEKAAIGVDPVGIKDIIDELDRRGFDVSPEAGRVAGVPQGWQMATAVQTVARALAAGTVRHGGRPMMAWVIGNARREQRGNAVIITKQASGKAKIDPLMALFDAATLMLRHPEGRRTVYDTRAPLLV